MISKNFLIFLTSIVSLLLFGCFASNDNNIKRYIASDHCKSSCWMEIEPDVTTKSQVLDILTKRYGADHVSIDDPNSDSWLISWTSNGVDLSDHGTVEGFQDKALGVWAFLSENKLKVQDLIAAIGNPYSVSTAISSINGNDVTCAAASLLYPPSGLEFYLASTPESVGVKSDQFVIGIRIISPWNPDESVSSDSSYTPWDGYREYCPKPLK